MKKSKPHRDYVVGVPTGCVHDGVFCKGVWYKNILWEPEPSLTIDKALYDHDRPYFRLVRITIKDRGTIYELPAELFDHLKIPYNYGNGANYRVAIQHWGKKGEQTKLKI